MSNKTRVLVQSGSTFTVQPGDVWENLVVTNGNGAAMNLLAAGAVVDGGGTEESKALFRNNYSKSHGGAVYNNGGSFSVTYAELSGNTAAYGGAFRNNAGTADFENVTFSGNSATAYGGAVYVNGAVTFKDVTFSGNAADLGAGIYNAGSSTVTLEGVTFSGNTARGGGAIMNYGTLNLGNVVFDGNTTTGGYGGAIYNLDKNAHVYFTGKVTLLTASDTLSNLAGGIYTIVSSEFGDDPYYLVIDAYSYANWSTLSSTISVSEPDKYETKTVGSDLYIKSKTADFGTAVFSDGGTASSVVIAGETFSGIAYDYELESAAINWGATNLVFDGQAAPVTTRVQIANAGAYHVRNGEFKNSSFNGKGGAIYNTGIASFENVSFTGNSAATEGGAIYNATGKSLKISGATFSGNTANHGGGIINYGTMELSNADFTGNKVGTNGGAIYSGAGSATISNAVFSGSSSGKWGGAFYNGTAAVLSNVSFTGNSAATEGGAIYSASGSSLTVSGATFTGNTSGNGGAVYTGATTASFENALFAYNRATGSSGEGGAIRNESSKTLTVSGATFSHNVSHNGGAIMARGTVTLGNVVFDGNTATNVNGGGGAFYAYQANVTINGKITLNTATDTIQNFGSSFTIDSAAFGGGAYYQVIDSAVKTSWSGIYSSVSVSDPDYEKLIIGNDLYVKSKTADFGTAVFSADGTEKSVVIAGQTYTGVAYDYGLESTAILWGATVRAFDGQGAAVTTRTKINSGEGYHVKNGTFENCVTANNGGVIQNSGGTVSFENVTFTGNRITSSNRGIVLSNENYGSATFKNVLFSGNYADTTAEVQGGAVYNTAGSTMTIEGATFSGNTATHGGGIMNYGTLVIGDVVFDGNMATGASNSGAVYNLGADATVTINGKITLKTASDVLHNVSGKFYIDAEGFGSGAYHQVIIAGSTTQWSVVNNATVSGDYEKLIIGTDLYIKSTTADFSTAVFSNGGTVANLEVAGVQISGVAYDFELIKTAKDWGAVNFAYDGYTAASDLTVSGGTMTGDGIIAFKGSSIGGILYGYGAASVVNGDSTFALENTAVGGFRGFGSNSVVNGDLTLKLKGATTGAVYTAYGAAVSGTVTTIVTGSTINGNLTPTASAKEKTTAAFVTELTDSIVNGAVRATGSSGTITVGSVSVTMTNSYAQRIYGTIGNTVTGDVTIALTGSTAADGILAHPLDADPYFIGGSVILALSGSNTVGGSITVDTFTNGGTLTLANDLTLTVNSAVSEFGTVSGAHTLTVNAASAITTGVTYSAVTLNNEATLTVTGNAFKYDTNKVVYYNVVDSTLGTHSTGDVVTVTINGVDTQAIYGVNAFASRSDIKNSLATVVAKEEIVTDTALGGGTNVLSSGSTITANLYGGTSTDYTGNIDLTLNGASSSATVLGGGSSLDSKVDGNIALTLTDATVDRIVYGGGQSGTVTGSITTTVSGDSKIGKNFYGGSLISSSLHGTYEAGAVNVNIEGGSFGGHVVGGSRVNGASFTEDTKSWLKQTVASVALNVTGGSFFERASVFAGGYLVGKQNKDVQLEVTNGVNLTLNADILGDTATYGSIGIYGGALASNYGTASIGKGTSVYAVQITVEDGHYSAIYGAGWAESNANSQVSGGVSIKVTGGSIGNLFAGGNNDTSGATANVIGNAVITLSGGTVDNVYASSKWGTSKITGSSKVNITGGTITGKLSGFNVNDRDSVVAGTEAAATGLQTLDLDASISCNEVLGFDVWEVAENATLTAAEEIDLKDVTLDFGSATSGWNIATAEDGFVNLDDATIKLGSVAWAWNETDTCWYGDTDQWKLSVKNKTLTLSKLA